MENKIEYSICAWVQSSLKAVVHETFTSETGVLKRYMELVDSEQYVMVVLREERKISTGNTSTIIAEWKAPKEYTIYSTRVKGLDFVDTARQTPREKKLGNELWYVEGGGFSIKRGFVIATSADEANEKLQVRYPRKSFTVCKWSESENFDLKNPDLFICVGD